MSIELMELDDVREIVREHYGSRVRSATSCCGSGQADACCSDNGAQLYSADELALVPDTAAVVSYGCGNPTALASLQLGEVVVDLGAGGGIDVFLAAQRVGASGFVYGVDMTDEMLALARSNAARMGVTNVTFVQGFIEALPLPDAVADVIISNCVVNLSPDKGATLREAWRVLKPGGRLAISDIVIDGDLSDLPVSEAQVRSALSWAGCIAGALTIDQLSAALATAGFVAIDIDVKHRFSMAELDPEMTAAAGGLSAEVAAQLANRFTSSNISARRPHQVAITAGESADLPAVTELLTQSKLPVDGLAGHAGAMLVARDGEHIVGSAALELYGESALLRSVAVDTPYRGEGLGQRLTSAALDLARSRGVSHVYLLTSTAGDYFPRLGFGVVDRNQIPDTVKGSLEFTTLCPASALAMGLSLKA